MVLDLCDFPLTLSVIKFGLCDSLLISLHHKVESWRFTADSLRHEVESRRFTFEALRDELQSLPFAPGREGRFVTSRCLAHLLLRCGRQARAIAQDPWPGDGAALPADCTGRPLRWRNTGADHEKMDAHGCRSIGRPRPALAFLGEKSSVVADSERCRQSDIHGDDNRGAPGDECDDRTPLFPDPSPARGEGSFVSRWREFCIDGKPGLSRMANGEW
jgi:hypothetical protein